MGTGTDELWIPFGLELEGEELERYQEVRQLRDELCNDPRRSITWASGEPRSGSLPRNVIPDYFTILANLEKSQKNRKKKLYKN